MMVVLLLGQGCLPRLQGAWDQLPKHLRAMCMFQRPAPKCGPVAAAPEQSSAVLS
jgi:hypothetical protein